MGTNGLNKRAISIETFSVCATIYKCQQLTIMEVCLFAVSVYNYVPVISCRRIPLPKAFIKFASTFRIFKRVRYHILAVKNRNKFIPHCRVFCFFRSVMFESDSWNLLLYIGIPHSLFWCKSYGFP